MSGPLGTYVAFCSASGPRRSSARRSSSPAGGAAGRGWRRRSASRRCARSPGGRCGCPARARRRSSRSRLVAAALGGRTCSRGSRACAGRCAAGCRSSSPRSSLASLPFIVERRFGILGTGLNPDMSQHLFAVEPARRRRQRAADRRRLSARPALDRRRRLGARAEHGAGVRRAARSRSPSPPASSALGAARAARRRRGGSPARCSSGFAYLLASTYVQGAFKEAMEALFLLAFAVGLGELAADWPLRRVARARAPLRADAARGAGDRRPLRLQLPGLALAGRRARRLGRGRARRSRRGPAASRRVRCRRCGGRARRRSSRSRCSPSSPRPELGRMVDFASFETFDPAGSGLGNLFNRLSPLEALGIWPSGDFRVEPGDGAVPAVVFYARRRARRRRARPSGCGGGGASASAPCRRRSPPPPLLWLYCAGRRARPYQEAKALVLIAPLAMLIAVRALLERAPTVAEARRILGRRGRSPTRFPAAPGWRSCASRAAWRPSPSSLGAGVSSLLALVNGPVGPSGYSPALAELRTELPPGSTWSSRPGSCSTTSTAPTGSPGSCAATGSASSRRASRRCRGRASTLSGRRSTTTARWCPTAPSAPRRAPGPGPCPLIPDAARADPSAGG